ncbi:TetR/AcrR family transcriptional regulator [Novosphingobium aquimarinum]|uniref:TetR/AcrR family transcriptional regulator n=1 Tax=Novosphingobium aquimarinum TaxID=2682494 RepID=UPI0012EBE60C|nr:TetR/AcrR family transcriptional regulator [Novosphingobium aquimarinum]
MTKEARAARAAYGTYSRAREKAARQTRDAIVTGAQDLFSKQGYGPTGIAQIAASAGVSRQTFYLHFSSKSAVLAELISEFERGLMALYEELAESKPALPQLVTWSRRFLEYCEADRKTVLLLLAAVPTEPDLAQDRANLYQRIMSTLGRTHPTFAVAASGRDPALRGRAVTLLAQVEALPRLAIAPVPLCDRDSLIEALAGNLLEFLQRG